MNKEEQRARLRQQIADAEAGLADIDSQQSPVEFPVVYETDKGKKTVPTLVENTKAVLDHYGVIIKYNEMSKEQEIVIPGGNLHEDNINNTSLTWLHNASKQVRYNISFEEVTRQVGLIADENSYHPVRDWIQSAEWDRESRFDDLLDTVESNHPMKEILVLRWLLSCVAALYEPGGVAAQGILVFSGKQGIGKTTWIKRLVGHDDWVKDGVILDAKNKDIVLKAISHWIVEIGELGSTFKKSDIDELKAFITERADVVRPPYGKKANKYARRTIFYASVDRNEFMEDEENRRFWTLDVTGLKPFHDIDVQQLWAEMYHHYKSYAHKKDGNVPWILTRKELVQLREHNQQFKSIDPLIEMLTDIVKHPTERDAGVWVNATQILEELGYSRSQFTKKHTNRVASWCREMEFQFHKKDRKYRVIFNHALDLKRPPYLKSIK